VEEADENRRAAWQHLDGKELFQVFERYTSAQLRILNSLRFSIDDDTRKTPKLPVSKRESLGQQRV